MPYALLEKDYDCLTDSQQRTVGLFVRFLLSQRGNDLDMPFSGFRDITFPVAVSNPQHTRQTERKLGGFEKGFYMSPDFDEPLDDFAEYM